MKKLVIILILLFFSLPVFADYMPAYVNKNLFLGDGFITSKEEIKIYKEKDLNSQVIGFIKGGNVIINRKKLTPENVFISSVESKNLHLIAVDNNDDEWFYACVNQKNKTFGYIKKEDYIDYFSVIDFYNFFGRKNGLYIFRNVPEKYKKLYAKPDIESNAIDSFLYPKYVSAWLIAREWMLVKVVTYDGNTKTGWFRWRGDNGEVFIFPYLKD